MGDHLRKLYTRFAPPGPSSTTHRKRKHDEQVQAVLRDLGDDDISQRKRRDKELQQTPFISLANNREASSLEREPFIPLSDAQMRRHRSVASMAGETSPDPDVRRTHRSPTPEDISESVSLSKSADQSTQHSSRYYTCLWRKPTPKKNKTWDGDGIIIASEASRRVRLVQADSHAVICEDTRPIKCCFEAGETTKVAGREVEIEEEISTHQFITQQSRKDGSTSTAVVPLSRPSTTGTPYRRAFRPPSVVQPMPPPKKVTPSESTVIETVPATSFYSSDSNKNSRPSSRVSGLRNPGHGPDPHPLYDPSAQGAVVMERPSDEHQRIFNTQQRPVVDVIVNPIISQALRPHQIQGIRFLYERVLFMSQSMQGINPNDATAGAILADEMGLGKTLQTIAVIDMLLKQNCYYSYNLKTIDRVLIVCPLSVVHNWCEEFQKWLGQAVRVKSIGDQSDVRSALNGTYQVMIINYDKLIKCSDLLTKVRPSFGLLVCDEAHRLKNVETKTTRAIQELGIQRRILLTGTPLQNDISEYYTMIELAAPTLLKDISTFRKVFEEPIMRSREPGCSEKIRRLGAERLTALQVVTQPILLRRTAEILEHFLPPKHEIVVFCAPSQLQLQVYEKILQSETVRSATSGQEGERRHVLPLISILRKLCNSPELLIKKAHGDGAQGANTKAIVGDAMQFLPDKMSGDFLLSGKLYLLKQMLEEIHSQTDDKVVIASHFTSTLDLVEAYCKGRYSYLRVDGQTSKEHRKNFIRRFNTRGSQDTSVFLLSCKTGGQGINLIGANRLILLDGDWNPAQDDQTMARIHRDGQKKPCWIYRLLLSGTMDEKIFIRQMSKRSLSSSLMGSGDSRGGGNEAFTLEELRAIFQLHKNTSCLTHDLLQCTCHGRGEPIAESAAFSSQSSESDPWTEQSSPPGFTSASSVVKDPSLRSIKDYRMRLAQLLEWAHDDLSTHQICRNFQDPILSSIISWSTRHAPADGGKQSLDENAPVDLYERMTGEMLFMFSKSTSPFSSANAVDEVQDDESSLESEILERGIEYP